MKNCMQKNRAICIVLLLFMLFIVCSPFVFADNELNGVGSTTTTTQTVPQTSASVSAPADSNTGVATQTQPVTQPASNTTTQATTGSSSSGGIDLSDMPASHENAQEVNDTANAIGGMFAQAGPDAQDVEKANRMIEPVAKILNTAMAVILGITSLLMMFITILDLLYMAFPPIRDILDGGRSGMGNMQGGRGARGSRGMGRMGMGMNGGMGMGMNPMGGGMGMGPGMGMGMNPGMGGQGMGQQAPVGGGLSAVGRWVSDEAVAACMESQGGIAQGMGAPMKSMIFSYMKKRALFLILFGVCAILFTSTVFTDLGVRIGTWILKLFM